MINGRHDKVSPKIQALSYGVTLEQYRTLGSYDLACVIKAGMTRERRMLEWLRWAVSVIITPHYQKPVDPEKLFSFPDEMEERREALRNIEEEDKLAADFFAKVFEKERQNKKG